MKKSPHTSLLLQQHRLKRQLDEARIQHNRANVNAREATRRADEASTAARDMGEQMRRRSGLLRTLRWRDPQTDDVEIRLAVRVPAHQVMTAEDPAYIFACALEDLAVLLASNLAKHSLTALRNAISREHAQTFARAKRDWMMDSLDRSPRYYGVDPDTLSAAWDAAVAAIIATAKEKI